MKSKKNTVTVRYVEVGQRSYKIVHEFEAPVDANGKILWNEVKEEDQPENYKANSTVIIKPEWEKQALDRAVNRANRRKRGRRPTR